MRQIRDYVNNNFTKSPRKYLRHQGKGTRDINTQIFQEGHSGEESHKQRKIHQCQERHQHLVNSPTIEEKNKIMRVRAPIFDRPNRTKIKKQGARATKKKTPKI